jgi:hypothetical protein
LSLLSGLLLRGFVAPPHNRGYAPAAGFRRFRHRTVTAVSPVTIWSYPETGDHRYGIPCDAGWKAFNGEERP